jgi:hypothetical protein
MQCIEIRFVSVPIPRHFSITLTYLYEFQQADQCVHGHASLDHQSIQLQRWRESITLVEAPARLFAQVAANAGVGVLLLARNLGFDKCCKLRKGLLPPEVAHLDGNKRRYAFLHDADLSSAGHLR